MDLTTSSISYQIDPSTGTTRLVVMGLRGTTDKLTVNFNITLAPSDVTEGTLDDLSRKELTALASKKAPATISNFTDYSYSASVMDNHITNLSANVTKQSAGIYAYATLTLTGDDMDLDTADMTTVKAAIVKVLATELPDTKAPATEEPAK